MKSLLIALCVAVSLLGAAPVAVADETLLFSGTCRNVTHGIDGLLKLFVLEKADGTLQGYMSISGWLVGSGPVAGKKVGNRYQFSTRDPHWGLSIDWDGTQRSGKLSGEYITSPNAKLGTGKQVGEWAVTIQDSTDEAATLTEQAFKNRFLLMVETDLNADVQLADGSTQTGAQALFSSVHPIGTGVSVSVNDVAIEWKDGASKTSAADIHRYTVDYTLYWHGIIQANGHTKLRLTYNNALQTVTAHEVIETTGTTKSEVGEIAFGIGVLLGKAAVESMLNSK
ncbi:hypothetical protein [Verrucomicrobium sp. BvORR034]|uniref:hypothetical protein n=1 Tax=Verrucomicrobium sp. BvORR034 TaxID=1396418 RepID=UPI0006789BE6|nr:hypothetical protein [Verrucomicrobium sp. BvORR034]